METNNPYAPPKAPVEQADGAPGVATEPLYTVGQMMLATFLGSVFAGAWLAASNFAAIGQPVKARQTRGWGVAGTAVTVLLALFLPDKFPNFVIPVATIFLVRALALRHFETVLREHFEHGGAQRSWWRAVGIGFLCLLVLMLVAGVVGGVWGVGYYMLTGEIAGS